jgi:hypothetical protein
MPTRMFLALLFCVLLSGCATSYQPKSFTGGYSETRLREDIFEVSFRGNGYTSRERAADFSLLRSAELAIENGFSYFIIINSEKDASVSTYTSPSTSHTTLNAYGSGQHMYGNAATTTYAGQTYYVSKPGATNRILCFRQKPENDAIVFEAQFIVNSIRTKYGLTQ